MDRRYHLYGPGVGATHATSVAGKWRWADDLDHTFGYSRVQDKLRAGHLDRDLASE